MNATPALAEQIANLEKSMQQVLDQVGEGLGGHRMNPELGTVTYFEDEPGDTVLKSLPITRRGRKFFRPKGYKSEFKSFGNYLVDMATNRDAFSHKQLNSIKLYCEKAFNGDIKKATVMQTLNSDQAGALVLPEFAPTIAEFLYDNDLLSRTNQFTISGNSLSFPRVSETSRANGARSGGVTGQWLEENDPGIESAPKVAVTEVRLRKLCVIVYITSEMLEDSAYALEQWVRTCVTSEIKFMTGDAIINGTGGGMPLGILQSPARIVVPKVSGQANDTILARNVDDMLTRRRAGAPLSDYVWLCNQDIQPSLNEMVIPSGSSGVPVYLPPGGYSAQAYGTLRGLPLIPVEFCPTLGDEGDLILANLKNYHTCTKGGITEAASTHVDFLRDRTAFRFTFRIGGRPLFDSPLTPYKGNKSQSDFVTLEAR